MTDDLRARLAELTLRDAHRLKRKLDRARRSGDTSRVEKDIERAEQRVAVRRAAVPAVSYPPELPVSARRDDLLAAIRDNQVVVVAGETGSGKTTQIPKLCLELGRGVRGAIAHTQPRRLAARTVSERIAEELNVPLGGAVGFAVRFSDRSSEETLVRLMTDGLLLAEIHRDPLLRRYDTVIVDEAHERSLNIDFLLGYLARILPRRPDLKVIITSATIDPERFAAHFGGAPVVEVSGRTYPVELRYREPPEKADLPDSIGDAVQELLREAPGDVLVFLSGEREIRDTADALRGRLPDHIELLPLYARLVDRRSAAGVQAALQRRVVLATNVAETSLTVPGIRYVVDPGTARISRYSARLKVQRLPIEPISQASADQRKGRCGRTSDGIAIRLYSEEDFEERPRFTDPEILRTSLAAVILRMAALELGDIEDFPFLDPPDRRQVRDGVRLLQELGALDDGGALTQLGRQLSQLQVDPRLGRMIIEAGRLDCAREVIPIVAALSIQDPRERPADAQAQADQSHARFADETSDFMALLNLWRYLRERQRALSGSQFRKRVREEYLHYLRVREWQDLAGELRRSAKEIGVSLNQEDAEPADVHRALLTGLLSQVGVKDSKGREYAGARGARFATVAGLRAGAQAAGVGDGRRAGRDLAPVGPRRGEDRAPVDRAAGRAPGPAHLQRAALGQLARPGRRDGAGDAVRAADRHRAHRLLRADRAGAGARAVHPPRAGRGRLGDPARVLRRQPGAARGGRRARAARPPPRHPRRRRDAVPLLRGADPGRHRLRRALRPLVADARRADPDLLTFTQDLLIDPAAAEAVAGRPDSWKQGELVLPLSYRFEPGSEHDGVTVHVPLKMLPQLRSAGFDWLVPAFRLELVTELLRSLPKDVRRRLVPAPEVAAAVLERLKPRKGRFTDAVARELEALRGVRVTPADFDLSRLPAHLRMTFRVEDEAGALVAEGKDLDTLREQARPRLRDELAQAARGLEATGLTSWTIGELPRVVALPGTGQAVRGYPALVDEGSTVGVRVLETPAAQRVAMAAGTRRLLLLGVSSPVKAAQSGLPMRPACRWRARPTRAWGRCSRTPSPPRSTRWWPRPAAPPGTRRASRGCAATSRDGCPPRRRS